MNESEATLIEELTGYGLSEDDAKLVTELVRIGESRVVQVRDYYVIEVTATIPPNIYTPLIKKLSRLSALPPHGHATYLTMKNNYAILVVIDGMKLYGIVVISTATEAENYAKSSNRVA